MIFKNLPYRDPLVLDDVVNVVSLRGVGLEHALDEVLGIPGDVGPLRLGELVLPRPDPLLHARGNGQAVVTVERGEATQAAERRYKQHRINCYEIKELEKNFLPHIFLLQTKSLLKMWAIRSQGIRRRRMDAQRY